MAYKFYGGVHPPTFKGFTSDSPIKKVFIPQKVIIPLLQHTGSPAESVISVGDSVKVGQLIAKPTGFISSSVHATISGKVTKISHSPTPVYGHVLSVSIESKDEDQEFNIIEQSDPLVFSKGQLLGIIRDSGIVGLGGAAFPTHVKLSPPKEKPIDSIILNGAECEPYLTCDHRLMVEKSHQILKGLEIIAKILDVKKTYIAIENNKLSAIFAMEKALSATSYQPSSRGLYRDRGLGPEGRLATKIVILRTKYPQGAEKQLIKSVLDRVVPAGGLPLDVGCVVHNVGTAFAIYEAVYLKKPLIERCITITGACVKTPLNLWVRIGTLLSDLKDSFGGFTKEPAKIIIGGPMMGVAQYTMDVPITKRVNGVLFLSKEETQEFEEGVCIRCGKCIEVCPMGLSPTALMHRVKKERFLEAKDLGILNCYDCGACVYECPAKIPLLDYIKFGKAKNG